MNKPTLQAISSDSTADSTLLDPFNNLEKLRLNPSFVESAGVKKLRINVPVRRPNPQTFIRVNPDPAYMMNCAIIELKEDREEFLVLPHLAPELPGEVVMKTLFTCITRQGDVVLWPVRLPSPDDKRNDWWQSAREIAELAMSKCA
jgi:hypothetical protein